MPLATELSNRVGRALLNDPRTDQSVIEVTAENGVVTLAGSVDSAQTRQAAEEIACSQPGVLRVINELTVA